MWSSGDRSSLARKRVFAFSGPDIHSDSQREATSFRPGFIQNPNLPPLLPGACQLFLPLSRNPLVCLICGGAKSQHRRSPPEVDETGLSNSALHNCPYDVRAEFVPKNHWNVKFGSRIPIVLGDDNYVKIAERRPDQNRLSTSTDSILEGPFSESEVLNKRCLNNNSLSLTDMMPRNSGMLSPSVTSAFEDYRIIKAKLSPETSGSENKNVSSQKNRRQNSVKFKRDDRVISREGGMEYFELSENEVSSLSSDSPSDHDYDNLEPRKLLRNGDVNQKLSERRETTELECEVTNKNTEFNSDQKNFQLAPVLLAGKMAGKERKLADGKSRRSESHVLGSAEREIDREIDKILGTSHKLQSIEPKLKESNSPDNLPDSPVVPIPLKPSPIQVTAQLNNNSIENFLLATFPLMKSQSVIHDGPSDPFMSQNCAIKNEDNKTTISIDEAGDMLRPRSAKPDFVPSLVLTSTRDGGPKVEDDDYSSSLAGSTGRRASLSPSPGRELSEASSNLSTERKSNQHVSVLENSNGVVYHSPPVRKLVVKEMTPSKPKRKGSRINEHVEEKLRVINNDLRRSNVEKSVAFAPTTETILRRKSEERLEPTRPALSPPKEPTKTYLNTLNGYTNHAAVAIKKSFSSSSVPRLVTGKFNSFDEKVIDIGVCRYVSRARPSSHTEEVQDEVIDTQRGRRSRGKFSSLRKLLPKFERSSSQPAGSFRKLPGGVRASFSFKPGATPTSSRATKRTPSNCAKLFHSVDETCSASEEWVYDENSVTVKEILEPARNVRFSDENLTQYTKQPGKAKTKDGFILMEKSKLGDHKETDPPKTVLNLNQHLLLPAANRKYSHHFKSSATDLQASSDTISSIFSYEESFSDPKSEMYSSTNSSNLHRSVSKRSVNGTTAVNGPVWSQAERRREVEDRYNQIAHSHMTTLSFIAEHMQGICKKRRREEWLGSWKDVADIAWVDFRLLNHGAPVLLKETAIFYKAALISREGLHQSNGHFNLLVSPARYSYPVPKNTNCPFLLPSLLEFQDRIPNKILRNTSLTEEEDSGAECPSENRPESLTTLCKVTVLPGVQISTLDSFADSTTSRHHPFKLPHIHERETCFILIQLISCLKFIQSQGIEELCSDLDAFLLLINRDSTSPPQLALMWESLFAAEENTNVRFADTACLTLCQCALSVLCMLLHTEIPIEEILQEDHVPLFSRLTSFSDGFQKVAEALQMEKAASLTQAKSLLEYMFWIFPGQSAISSDKKRSGQSTIPTNPLSVPDLDGEYAVKLWLDVERSKTVNAVVKTLIQNKSMADLVEQYRLDFLLHASPKHLYEAALMLNSHKDVVI